ncbi:molecular chaperone DjiA [Jannaschia seohaensis]|uniref:DnaJ like chaperone protein n=1 Tax=Jannaschia seohaensis TaxID=475081 RepID=A0A2Y9A2Q7_9RHOB|nr:molecular chaperone DjiA [Jannaschia seohaensis]PWJ22503.1 DnaJ like chaperone protein [Jannaschia seohaensis]SSA38781.1 DnaJ like chaperone protein [Jannaschia seohaensis]
MTIWQRIMQALARLAPGERLSQLFEPLRAPPERSVAFTIAVIALSAKMAKADGRVTRDEVTAFREVFVIPEREIENAARVFDLARTDVAGFEHYAARIAAMFKGDGPVLRDLMEGLFHIALADGDYHPAEDAFLTRVAEIFGIPDREFRALRTRLVPGAEPDCWEILGVEPGAPMEEVRAAWRAQVRETHPDRMVARGLPEEAVKLAEKRLVAINRAWERIQAGTA